MGDYKPQITVEKGVVEGMSAVALAGIVATIFGLPEEQSLQIAGSIGAAVAMWKMARNWWKNRKGVPA